MGVFQGHQVSSILFEIILAVFWLILILLYGYPKVAKGMRFRDWFYLYVFILVMPNSTYAFFELKHLLVVGLMAEPLNGLSVLVFGSVALLGFLMSILQSQLFAKHYTLGKKRNWIHLAVSLILGFGAVAGEMNYASIVAVIFPFSLIDMAFHLLASPGLIGIALATATLLFFYNLLVDHLHKPSP